MRESCVLVRARLTARLAMHTTVDGVDEFSLVGVAAKVRAEAQRKSAEGCVVAQITRVLLAHEAVGRECMLKPLRDQALDGKLFSRERLERGAMRMKRLELESLWGIRQRQSQACYRPP